MESTISGSVFFPSLEKTLQGFYCPCMRTELSSYLWESCPTRPRLNQPISAHRLALLSMVSLRSRYKGANRSQGSPEMGWKSYTAKAIPLFFLETCSTLGEKGRSEIAGNQAETVQPLLMCHRDPSTTRSSIKRYRGQTTMSLQHLWKDLSLEVAPTLTNPPTCFHFCSLPLS